MKIAFAGLGVMGAPMARHLVQAGHDVVGFNRTISKAQAWAEATGGRFTKTVAEAAQGVDLFILCVGNDDDVRAVVTEGLPHLAEGAVIVDHTTTSAKVAREMAALAEGQGRRFVDAPVSGGVGGATGGTLTFMVGGSTQAFTRAQTILDKMGKKVYIFYTDYAMGQSDGRQFKTALERLGGEVVGVAGAPLDTKDFSPWFGAINASGADVLFLAFAGTDSLRLMTQLHSFGMTKKYKLAGIDCFLLQQDLAAIAEPMEGFVQLNHFSAYNPDPNMQAFNQKFKKKFGVDANIAAGAYDAVYFWKTAVEKAGSFDSDKVSAAHEGLCTDATHIGRQCIRKEDHQVVMDMHLYRVEKGKNLPIARIDGKDAIGAAMVGQDPLKGFTWEIKKK